MNQSIKLTRITNGWLLDWNEEEEDNEGIRLERDMTLCIEDKGNISEDNDETLALAEVLRCIAYHFDFGYRKHYAPGKKFIKISLVDGDNYFDTEVDESEEE